MNNPILTPAGLVSAFNELQSSHHDMMVEKGFWRSRQYLRLKLVDDPKTLDIAERAMDCQLMALIHTEVSEAVESIRHGSPPDDKIPEFSGPEAELADVFLRIMDVAQDRKWRVIEAVVAKIAMNAGREKMHGGKLF